MGRSFVHPNRFAVQLDHVHDFDRIVGILFAQKLHETVALVHLRYAIFGHMDVHHRAGLDKHLPQERLRHFVIQSADVDSGICKQSVNEG